MMQSFDNDYLRYYDLESYLFDVVRNRFQAEGCLSVFDFFCIVIWKTQHRVKSIIAQRLLSQSHTKTLEEAVHVLTRGIANCPTPPEKFKYLLGEDWGFRLPLASAILTVLYPDDFTVYDVRVCEQLRNFQKLANWEYSTKLWNSYLEFVAMVRSQTPSGLSLRDKDRYLFGKSIYDQLMRDIEQGFGNG